MSGAVPPLPQYVFMVWCLVKHRDNFTFYLYLGVMDVAAWLVLSELGSGIFSTPIVTPMPA